ncbi:MAG TPA: glycosyltransferase family 4 protein [Gemmatimonadaceae bacterium]
MRVTFTIGSLGMGGAEHVLVTMAESFVRAGHELTVITVYGAEHDFFQLPAGVRRVALAQEGTSPTLLHAVRNNWHRVCRFREAIVASQPQLVVAHMTENAVLSVLALAGTGIPVVAIEQVDPGPAAEVINRWWRGLRRVTFPRLAMLVTPSGAVDAKFGWMPATRRRVIANPMPAVPEVPAAPAAPGGRRTIVALGRLVRQKGFDMLIDAFARLAPCFPDWDLRIVGEGELREPLERQVREQGLESRVALPGSSTTPWEEMRRGDLFALSSRFEGLPGALIGAMACGVPAVSFDCPSGPRDIVRHGVDGLLVPDGDTAAFEEALASLMADDARRAAMAQRAVEVRERFGPEAIQREWDTLLTEVAR